MKRPRPAAAVLGLAITAWMPLAAQAEPVTTYGLKTGAEWFQWREFDASGDEILEETGPRYFVGIDVENDIITGWVYGLHVRLYGASVDYDGQTTGSVVAQPVETEVGYTGYRAVLDFVKPLSRFGLAYGHNWSLKFGVGVDAWTRDLQDTTTEQGDAVSGYEEDWRVPFVSAGLAYGGRAAGWYNRFGLKYPFGPDETIEDLGLSPQPDFSFFLQAGYRTPYHWDVALYYDGYRFDKSDPIQVTAVSGTVVRILEVWQPESRQDTYGVTVRYWY